MSITRRDLCKTGFVLLGASGLAPRRLLGQSASGAEPHFFLFINLFPGADPSYLFDARPLALKAAGKMQNYLSSDPTPWVGGNGGQSLATSLVAPLQEFRSYFSVVNGVMMSTFDGHEQNQDYLYTGNGLGGASFIPFLNTNNSLPIDNLQLDGMTPTATNSQGSLSASAQTLAEISSVFSKAAAFPPGDATSQLMAARMAAIGLGGGRFSTGSRNMAKAFQSSGSLATKLKNIKVIQPSPAAGTGASPSVNSQVIGQFFLQGITRSLVVGLAPTNISLFDTHAPDDAAQQPATFASAIASLAELLGYLKNTPCDAAGGKSLLDVTTFLVGSEFARTMRQPNLAIDKTGTDHNPLNNSFIIGGKGIKPGIVLGASDMTAVDAAGNLLNVSGAHRQLDPELLKTMGMPFDFTNFTPLPGAQPATFDITQYLNFGSITNTLYQVFDNSQSTTPYLRVSAGGNIMPVLTPLIA